VYSDRETRQHPVVLTGTQGELMAQYDRRIATRITRDADNRLRLASLVLRRPLSAVLTDALDKALPSADELAERLQDMTAEEGAA
jgi:hypothetical protein